MNEIFFIVSKIKNENFSKQYYTHKKTETTITVCENLKINQETIRPIIRSPSRTVRPSIRQPTPR